MTPEVIPMSQPTQVPHQHDEDKHKPKPAHTVQIIVNSKKVEVPKKVTGAQIKAAAGVPADFDLFHVHGRKEDPVGDNQELTVTKGEKFVASPTLDPSFVVQPEHQLAIENVRDTFPDHTVDIEVPNDGTTLITVRQVAIGEGWNHSVIDLAVKLQVTFPSTPPYPFYGPAGMARTDGLSLSQIQPQVQLDGQLRTQISLNKPFDPAIETLGSRVAAVACWLRSPR
jgi:hypothetical protein